MAYCTLQELSDRFGQDELVQLSDPQASAINPVVVQRAIDDASNEMDGHLQSRYTLPLADPPVLLNRLCADMARYHLYGGRVAETVKQVRERYEDAVKTLRLIAKGEVSLGLSVAGAVAPVAQTAEMQHAGSVFSREEGGFL